MVRLAPPPPDRPPDPLIATLPPGARLVRIYDPTRYGATANSFRHNGPRERFDHQRALAGAPADDRERGITYAARTFSGALVEVFGDTGVIEPGERMVGLLTVTRPLLLLDLRGAGAMRAGSVAALAKIPDRPLSQAWSRFFYERADLYSAVDGLWFSNAHNDEEALALYERAVGALACAAADQARLDDPALRPALLAAARANHLRLGPMLVR